ncbi:MAG: Bax inhibitor-1/YccA family protein [Bacteroides sp.]|nr:Bax inhibitor-1/YccA family protein [Prevotella sp.]MCM1407504.1 Bax inhibitor-1/YccA family protein [Treponema brennaborense]MCM1469994.1 Bax inhibitor-1/YccA family protein [Bacteroides sp.]
MNLSLTTIRKQDAAGKKFIAGVYGWMTAALVITAGAAWFTAQTNILLRIIYRNPIVLFGLIIGELLLVFWVAQSIKTISSVAAAAVFVVYAVLNGVTLASVFFVYTKTSIFGAFISSALMFLSMTLYGLKTKSNLMSAGRYLFMALTGIIAAALVNFLLRSPLINWIISLAAIAVFTALTAYDTQKMLAVSSRAADEETAKKASVITALELYLDFINIFLSLLRISGKQR